MPTTVVKGTHVYQPTATIAPTNLDTPGDGGCVVTMSSVPPSIPIGSEIIAGNTAGDSGTSREMMVDERMTDAGAIGSSTLTSSTTMDIDKNDPSSPLLSLNLGKHMHCIMSLDSSDMDGSWASNLDSTPATSL